MMRYALRSKLSATWGAVMVVALFLTVAVFAALDFAIDAPTFHLDGAFQTASGLFRLGNGQAPGRDFYPYLGIGPLLLAYPFYVAAGGDLAASVFAAHFVTVALGAFSVSIVWHLICRPRSPLYSACAGASVMTVLLFQPAQYPVPDVFAFAIEPGNSLRPIRAAAPYLMAMLFLHISNQWQNHGRRDVLFGLIIGVTMLWSNDFAIPTAAMFSLVFCGYVYTDDKSTWKKSVLTFAATAVFSWMLFLLLVTAGQPLKLLHYNFIDVARDQWWYFGPYGPTSRVFELGQLARLISRENGFGLVVLAAVVLLALRTRRRQHVVLLSIGMTLFLGGCVASIGGHLGNYFGAFSFWAAAVMLCASLQMCRRFLARFTVRHETLPASFYASLLGAVAVGMLAGGLAKFRAYNAHLAAAATDDGRFYVKELGAYLGVEWKDYIAYARANRHSKTIEDYWGVWSSLNRTFAPWPVDSAIHALGEVREAAKDGLTKADIIVSTRYTAAADWQPWNVSQNFWFYNELLSNWVPDFISPKSVVWRKSASRRGYLDVPCRISPGKDKIILEPSSVGYYRVELDYRFAGRGRHLLMVKNNISFGSDAGGYVSISPHASHTTIPVLVDEDSGSVFDSKVIGESAERLVMASCRAQKIAFHHNEVLPLSSHEDFYLTDENWVRGIARRHTGFFVPNLSRFREQYKPGRSVRMKNGDTRTITQVTPSGKYLNVAVDGPLLHADQVGLPDKFEVL